jgi:hypothetical protein
MPHFPSKFRITIEANILPKLTQMLPSNQLIYQRDKWTNYM